SFDAELPENPGYAELAEAFLPRSQDESVLDAAQKRLDAWGEAHGWRALEPARSGGQHTHPGGMVSAGTGPSWTRRTLDEFCARSPDVSVLDAAQKRLDAWGEAHGWRALEHARSGGQHTHPEGMFYGGTGPTWSRRTLEGICADYRLGERRSVAVIDFHTGL